MKNKILVLMGLIAGSALAATSKGNQVFDVTVTDGGYVPSSINVKPDVPVTLKVTRRTADTCATNIQIPAKKIKRDLPLNKTVTIEVGKLDKGEIRFGCSMGMMIGGKIVVQ